MGCPTVTAPGGQFRTLYKGWILGAALVKDKLCILDFDRDKNKDTVLVIGLNGKVIRKLKFDEAPLAGSNHAVYTSADGHINAYDLKGKLVRRMGSLGSKSSQFGRNVSEEGEDWPGPQYMAARNGMVYGYDIASNSIKQFTESGKFVRSIGLSALSKYELDRFAVDNSGTFYVSAMKKDGSDAGVLCLSSNGKLLRTIGSRGEGIGQFHRDKDWESGSYYGPGVITCGSDGKLYVVDSNTHEIEIFNPSGKALQTIPRHSAAYSITSLSVSKDGALYITGSDGVFAWKSKW